MDDNKDIENTSPLAPFFSDTPIRVNPFGGNQSAHRTYRRAERIVAALYLITNHVPAEEPLKEAIRSESIQLLVNVMALQDDMRTQDSAHVAACRGSIRRLISYVRTLSVARLLSLQNTRAASDGLDDLGNLIEVSKSSPLSESLKITRDDFLDIGVTTIKDIKDSRNLTDTSLLKDGSEAVVSRSRTSSMSVREQSILGVLDGAGELGIRDIVANLPEYSEKMVQRELASLVATGRVRKMGLKRWSRYSLVVHTIDSSHG